MNEVADPGQAVLVALNGAMIEVFTFLPRLAGALIVILIGVIVGRLVGGLVTRLLRLARFDRLADRAEIDDFLRGAGMRADAPALIGALAKWCVYLFAFQVAIATLGIPAVTAVLTLVLSFIPRLAVAVIILLVGAYAANLLASFVRGSLAAGRVSNAFALATLTRYGVLAVAVVAALSQLEIAPTIVNTLWMAVIGGIAFGAALAFGLGAREVAGHVAASQFLRADLRPGMRIALDGTSGTIDRIGPLYTNVRTPDGQVMVPNSDLARATLRVGSEPAAALPPRPPARPPLPPDREIQ